MKFFTGREICFFLSIVISVSGIGFFHPSISGANETADLQATSTVPVYDDRIAALWMGIPPKEGEGNIFPKRNCTASYIGADFWITAHHCIPKNPSALGYLEQSDGDVAGMESIYLLSKNDDVALIKVGSGINAEPFRLPNRQLTVGDEATLVGYGATNSFSSIASITITDTIEEMDFGTSTYTKLLESKSDTSSRSCSGDSGGSIYRNDTIYGVHTAGDFNPSCLDAQGGKMWHTSILPRRDWIEQTINSHKHSSSAEIKRAESGLELYEDRTSQNDENQWGISSSLSSVW